MKKLEFCYICPMRFDEPLRLQNLQTVLRHLDRFLQSTTFVVFEVDSIRRLKLEDINIVKNIKIEYRYLSSTSVFGRGTVINYAVQNFPARYYCFHDADCIIPREGYEWAYTMLQSGIKMVFPFSAFWCMDNVSSHRFRETLSTNALADARFVYRSDPEIWAGGVMFTSRAAFRKAGGFNDAFIGWGYEDTELHLKYRRIFGEQQIVYHPKTTVNCYHLYHPKDKKTLYYSQFLHEEADNKILYLAVERLTRNELLAYIDKKFSIEIESFRPLIREMNALDAENGVRMAGHVRVINALDKCIDILRRDYNTNIRRVMRDNPDVYSDLCSYHRFAQVEEFADLDDLFRIKEQFSGRMQREYEQYGTQKHLIEVQMRSLIEKMIARGRMNKKIIDKP